jgi:pre-rRNA-processing protein TSR1
MTQDIPTAELIASEKRRRELVERSAEDMEFPDEVDTPLDHQAKERFQKYRGLRSFRTSTWDPYEDLPVEYSRIWEFEAFNSTGRAYKQQFEDACDELKIPGPDGQEGETGTSAVFCTLFLRDVPPTVMETQARGVPFILSSLLPCEQKVSVVQGNVTRFRERTEVIKSKQEVWLHCGFRRFMARPTFSETPKRASTCKKFKFMRFLQQEASISMYAPVMFPPCRLLMFINTDTGPELAGQGSITGADPKQLVIKRSVLTGYPFKVHKSKAVTRFMFFNPSDIKWFKPVELSTKKGLRGHIVESVGTHGYMKCRFNGNIKQDDTVCMNLYKRVYPKWYPPSWGGRATDGPEEAPCSNAIGAA